MFQAGAVVKFGKYEQGKGIESIEWRVLDRQEEKVLLISRYALEWKEYHGSEAYITWEKCDLRKWLNNEFLNMAFSETERSMIANTRCPADKNPRYSTAPGNVTTDKIFLLSIPEAEKYFGSDEDRKAAPTAYAKKQGVDTSRSGNCWWCCKG